MPDKSTPCVSVGHPMWWQGPNTSEDTLVIGGRADQLAACSYGYLARVDVACSMVVLLCLRTSTLEAQVLKIRGLPYTVAVSKDFINKCTFCEKVVRQQSSLGWRVMPKATLSKYRQQWCLKGTAVAVFQPSWITTWTTEMQRAYTIAIHAEKSRRPSKRIVLLFITKGHGLVYIYSWSAKGGKKYFGWALQHSTRTFDIVVQQSAFGQKHSIS